MKISCCLSVAGDEGKSLPLHIDDSLKVCGVSCLSTATSLPVPRLLGMDRITLKQELEKVIGTNIGLNSKPLRKTIIEEHFLNDENCFRDNEQQDS